MAAGLEFQDRNKVCRVNQSFVFRPFGVAERALICTFAEHLDSRLYRRFDAKGNQTSSRFHVEAKTQRFRRLSSSVATLMSPR